MRVVKAVALNPKLKSSPKELAYSFCFPNSRIKYINNPILITDPIQETLVLPVRSNTIKTTFINTDTAPMIPPARR
jgi:hypothetical protein